jgi:SAM-dependent methyltransferase
MASSLQAAIDEAYAPPLAGWDFSWLDGRMHEEAPPWNFNRLTRLALQDAELSLDIDTGGGEFLASLSPLPGFVFATEGYQPNVTTAARRLADIGIPLVHAESAPDNVDQAAEPRSFPLPFSTGTFDVVINRHSSYWPTEVGRVLKSGGRFLTQQRSESGRGGASWEQLFGRQSDPRTFDLDFAVGQLRAAGFEITRAEEADTPILFMDLAAIVYYLRMIPWAVDEFDPVDDRDRLTMIAEQIGANGEIRIGASWMLLEAVSGKGGP